MAALAILSVPGVARATNYTITVDASKQTSGNPKFWAASIGTGTASLTLHADLQSHYKIMNRELGMQRVRGHGVLNDDMAIYKGAGSYSWTNFDKYLTAITSAGMRPIMELDFMPTALAKNGSSRDMPKDLTTYKQFIQAVVQHCVDKYGMDDVSKWYWEVWNEPDYPGFWNGTINDYYTLYDNAVDAITAVIPNAEVGGPATTEPSKIAAFLQHCKSANKRVTFVSSHCYPGGSGSSPANATSLVNDNNTRQSQITSGGYTTATVKSFNTEWNSSYSGQGGGTGDALESMDSHGNVGFILKAVKLLADKNSGDTPVAPVFSYWVGSDVFDESSGTYSSYIAAHGGTLPFGRVFGLMTYQGMRKAAFNAFKMLNYLGPKRLMSSGGTGSDGVDAMATLSANSDEIAIVVYDFYSTIKTTGTDMVTVNVSNLPTALANKEVFFTHFRVDETHSNPYSVWQSQGSPTNPSETQWQAMKKVQGLAVLDSGKAMVTTSYSTNFSIPRQAGSLILLSASRPVMGRNALVEVEAEDYDGQSGVTKEDSNDATLGQSISAKSGNSIFFNDVDFSDGGVASVSLRVNSSAATTIELHQDTMTGTTIGTCQVASTSGSWADQSCSITKTTGIHTLYVTFGGTVRLNWLKFSAAPSSGTGTGGSSGGTGGASGTGTGGASGTGSGGATGTGTGGSGSGTGGASGTGTGGASGTGSGGATGTGTGGSGSGGSSTGSGGDTVTGSGGDSGTGSGGDTGTTGSGGATDTTGSGGSDIGTGSGGSSSGTGSGGAPGATGGSSPAGCGCSVGSDSGGASSLLLFGLAAMVLGLRTRRARSR